MIGHIHLGGNRLAAALTMSLLALLAHALRAVARLHFGNTATTNNDLMGRLASNDLMGNNAHDNFSNCASRESNLQRIPSERPPGCAFEERAVQVASE